MIVIGAGWFAKELYQAMVFNNPEFKNENLFFFDNVSENLPNKILGKYKILRTTDEVREVFSNGSNEFCLGLSTPKHRYKLTNLFEQLGGKLTSVISASAYIDTLDTNVGDGCSVMHGTFISCNASIGRGTLLNVNSMIAHDVTIGEFAEIMPGVNITGLCHIGNYTSLGTGCILTPNVKIGNNCVIAAGSVVTKDIPDNSLVVGIMPSRVVEKLPKFEL